ncbi:CD82 antigen-like [Daphnia pulex]|uniref:CD82 antigen-like n=1 Tax=Daphnia pulex TaxID=6669 RepID=UPI001EE086A8|nr:CD82 antigen-like [Daphnia pulex]
MTDEVTFRSHKILRWSFLCLNLLILLSGIVLISLSASSLVQRQEFAKGSDKQKFLVVNDKYMVMNIVVAIAVSGLLIFLSLFGMCGAFGEKKCLISCYLVFVLLNLGFVIVGGIMVLRFSKITENSLKENISNYHHNKTSKIRVDEIRSKLNCCGIHAFYNLTYLQAEKETVTTSCCVPEHREACHDMLKGQTIQLWKWEEISQKIYTEGCLSEITKMSEPISEYILSFFVVIAVIDLAGLLLSVAMCCGV